MIFHQHKKCFTVIRAMRIKKYAWNNRNGRRTRRRNKFIIPTFKEMGTDTKRRKRRKRRTMGTVIVIRMKNKEIERRRITGERDVREKVEEKGKRGKEEEEE